MKIALGFSLKLKLFDFTSLRQGNFANDGEKPKILKALSKDTQRGLFHYRGKFLLCALLGQAPNPKSKKQRQNGTRFARVFSKAKRTIVKIFLKSDTKKRFFRGK